MTQSNCVFCKLAAGEVPSLKILETGQALAFLDIAPLAEGHVLFIPRAHYARLSEMPAGMAAELARFLPMLCRTVETAVGAAGCNILQNNGRSAGQVVEHVHFHIIPRRDGDGLGYRWLPQKYEAGRAEAVQHRLRQLIESTVA
jgi:histidine triad (HIT) family protein